MHRLVLIVFLFTISLSTTRGQDMFGGCEDGAKQATLDFDNCIMKVTSYGMIVFEDFDFEELYDKYLIDKFEIESSHGGCIVTAYEDCYSSKMYTLIKEKYGEDFFGQSRKEAEKLYQLQKSDYHGSKKSNQ